MNRKRVVIAGGIFSAMVLIYCLSFGPVVYLWTLSQTNHVEPTQLDRALTVVFQPHHWVMYHSEPYFEYVWWFSRQASDIYVGYTWVEFRADQDDHFD